MLKPGSSAYAASMKTEPSQPNEPKQAISEPPALLQEPLQPEPEPSQPEPEPTQTEPDLPPAAVAVSRGSETEQTANLERKLRAAELRASQLEDENHRLKTIPKPANAQKKAWLSGNSLFD